MSNLNKNEMQRSKYISGSYKGIPIRSGAIISDLSVDMAKNLCQALLDEQYSFRVSCRGAVYTIKLED
jgi:hypothetical protein